MAKKQAPHAGQTIAAYKLWVHTCGDALGQWDAKARTFKPFSQLTKAQREQLPEWDWLDAITHPIEAGVVPLDGWVKFLFGTRAVFIEFLDRYRDFDDLYRTHDRWYQALSALASGQVDEGFVRSDEICDTLFEFAQYTRQIR